MIQFQFTLTLSQRPQGPFGGLIASGFNTIAIYQRLVVEAIWNKGCGHSGEKPWVIFKTELVDDKGNCVLVLVLDALVRMRPA